MGENEQLLVYLQLCKGTIEIEDSIALLDELALLLASRQNHGLRNTHKVSYLA